MGGVKTPDRPRTPSKRIEGLADTTIHLPQLNSPARGPSKKAMGTPPDFDMPTPEGGYPSPVTSPRDGYRFTGVPPIVSR